MGLFSVGSLAGAAEEAGTYTYTGPGTGPGADTGASGGGVPTPTAPPAVTGGDVWDRLTGKKAADFAAGAYDESLDEAQDLYDPYTEAGAASVDTLSDLLGANGPEAQAAAIAALEGSEMFQGLVGQGESAILQNASATGGLRGGNVQGALAQFRPQMLQALIQQQMGGLSGLANLGLGATGGASDLITAGGELDASGYLADYDLNRAFFEDLIGGAINLATGIPTGSAVAPTGGGTSRSGGGGGTPTLSSGMF